MKRVTGRYAQTSSAGEAVRAFIPKPLPPDPELRLGHDGLRLLERASSAVGNLNGLTFVLPDASLFIYPYLRKEALLSSQIEGTQSSLSELLLFESGEGEKPSRDVEEVSRYVEAMNHGLNRLRRDDFPLSLRLIREIHGILLRAGRGSDKTPGDFRRSQNWIGGTRPGKARYVPPPPSELMACMGSLETYLQDTHHSTLLKAAMAHAQFESIHPFLDGNGRVGRLLITFLLCAEGVLQEPLLYLSLYFKRHRDEYYAHLQQIRIEGRWEQWVRFFLQGVAETAEQAVEAARRSLKLFQRDQEAIRRTFERSAGSGLQVHGYMQQRPVFSIPEVVREVGLTHPTVSASLRRMGDLGLVREITGKKTHQRFVYTEYLDLLAEGTESLP